MRRNTLALAIFCLLPFTAAGASTTGVTGAAPSGSVPSVSPERIKRISRDAMRRYHVKSLIVQVRVGGHNYFLGAWGDSMNGVPANPAMHFRNGAMAFTYMATMLLQFVDQGKVHLSDPLSKFFPRLPHAREITLRSLANMTAGYADYVYQPEILNGVNRDPFSHWTSDDLRRIGISKPMMFQPRTNWGYSHTDYVILGQVLTKVAGMSLHDALRRYIIARMGLRQTFGFDTPRIPEPVLHAFSSERREALGIPPRTPFYEEATFWDPSWTTATGAVQVTDITDMSRSMEQVGSGALLTQRSFREQVGPNLVGFGHSVPGCAACRMMTRALNYGLGVVNLGPWVTQTKLFAGSGATVGYMPSKRLTITVVTTYLPSAFDAGGNYKNASDIIFATLANAFAAGTVALPK